MSIVIPIGEPVNDAERLTIAHLRDHLPQGYLVVHNFEIQRGAELFEVDLAVIAPHAVYLVDVKGTRGVTDVHGSKWYPQGRQPFPSPLPKLRGHAKTLKGIITASQRQQPDLRQLYVDAAVVLTAPDARLRDPGGRDTARVTTLEQCMAFFTDASAVPGQYASNIRHLHKLVLAALQVAARPRSGAQVFGHWTVDERLGRTDAFTEYRAFNTLAGPTSGSVLLRVYGTDPYQPEDVRAEQRRRIANAYRALNAMPAHPGIVSVRDFFATEHEDRYVLATADIAGQALRLHMDQPALALDLKAKHTIAGQLCAALAHAHAHDVVHRNFSPGTVLVGDDGHARIVGFDYARSGTNREETIAHVIVDELEPDYQAPEVYREPQAASPASDMFSLGLVLYELYAGVPAFNDMTATFDQSAAFAAPASQHCSDVSPALDDWLQALCAFDAEERPSATHAAGELEALLGRAAHQTGR